MAHPASWPGARPSAQHGNSLRHGFLVTWLTIGWIRPATTGDALRVGVLWLVLTLAFEFLVGHYVFHKPWLVLLQDYDLSRGRIWVAVLVVVLLAPLWTARLRGLLQAAGHEQAG